LIATYALAHSVRILATDNDYASMQGAGIALQVAKVIKVIKVVKI
jgi:hypothetical protein